MSLDGAAFWAGGKITLLGSGHVTIASGAGDTDPCYATRGINVL